MFWEGADFGCVSVGQTLGRATGLSEINVVIRVGAIDATKPYKCRCGDIHNLKTFTFIGFQWAFISQTLM